MSTEEELNQLDASMAEAKHFIDIKKSVEKLFRNREFKKVILEYYFKEEAARLVMAKSSFMNDDQKQLIDNMIYGVGALKNWLESVMRRGDEMDQAIEGHEKTREELLQEEVLQ